MRIIVHAHHSEIPDGLRARAERAASKLAGWLDRPVGATVCFEQDGPERRVEITLRASHRRSVVAVGHDRRYGTALAQAVSRVEAQVRRLKRTPKSRGAAVSRP